MLSPQLTTPNNRLANNHHTDWGDGDAPTRHLPAAPPPAHPPEPRYPYKKDVGFVMSLNVSIVGVTSHTNYQLAPPPTPPPKGRGVITEIPL